MVTSILLARKLGDKYSVDYKKNQHLSSFQFEALIGLMLGDVFAERNKPTHNTRLNFEQSLRSAEHESYLLFLYSIFKNLVGTAPKSPKRKPHSITRKTYSSLAFKTLAFPFFKYFSWIILWNSRYASKIYS